MTRMGRGFSIEMESKSHVKSISISDKAHDRVLFEGDLGELKELSMIDGEVLEIKGAHGTLRIDLREKELRKILEHPQASNLSSEVGSYTSTKKKEMKRSEAE